MSATSGFKVLLVTAAIAFGSAAIGSGVAATTASGAVVVHRTPPILTPPLHPLPDCMTCGLF